jgi:hypothetical protein
VDLDEDAAGCGVAFNRMVNSCPSPCWRALVTISDTTVLSAILLSSSMRRPQLVVSSSMRRRVAGTDAGSLFMEKRLL